MKKALLFFFCLATAAGFTESLVLNNQTTYPSKNLRIAVQWATSASEVVDSNNAVLHGHEMNADTMQTLKKTGQLKLTIPKSAQYFRVIAWSKEGKDPDLLTNWVDVVPNKTYLLETGHLIPAVLMPGAGC